MILDVPTSDEPTQAGTNLLNLAWGTDQPYRQISSSMRIRSQPGLAGRGVCAAKLGDALAPHDAVTSVIVGPRSGRLPLSDAALLRRAAPPSGALEVFSRGH